MAGTNPLTVLFNNVHHIAHFILQSFFHVLLTISVSTQPHFSKKISGHGNEASKRSNASVFRSDEKVKHPELDFGHAATTPATVYDPKQPPQDFVQLMPHPAITPEEYAADAAKYHHELKSNSVLMPKGMERITTPYPLYIPPNRQAALVALHDALHTGLSSIVRRWYTTPRLVSSIPITSPKVDRVLRKMEESRGVYKDIGGYRPDFLIPERVGADVLLCEINARFMWNGFWIGTYQGECLEKLNLTCGEGLVHGSVDRDAMTTAFNHLIDPALPLGILVEKEITEGHFLDSTLAQRIYPLSRIVKPGDLTLSEGVLSDKQGPLTQFVLELHQHELESLPEDILFHLAQVCHNDLRTIYLVHDKRMLGVLKRELNWLVEMGDISNDQAECIRRSLPETYSPSDDMFKQILIECEGSSEGKNEWVMKKCKSGKGKGMVFGKSVVRDEWNRLMHSQLTAKSEDAEYILQRYVPQRKFSMVVHKRDLGQAPTADAVQEVNWSVVGSLLCVNGMYLGSPMWRTNALDIIAVGDHGLSPPSVVATRTSPPPPPQLRKLVVPPSARIPAPSSDAFSTQVVAAREALQKHGLAIVDMKFEDPESEYVLNLIDRLGLGEAISHSSSHGVLWDVRPVNGLTSQTHARSMTMESFPWHTDCSYEAEPPRYFALHILHRDRFGGGILRLLSTESLVARLSPQSREALQKDIFSVRVPEEFRKDLGRNEIIAPVLAKEKSTGLWKIRFRRDITEGLTAEAKAAIEELDKAMVMDGNGHARALGEDVMRDRAIVLLDNARWLHARSDVHDPDRWLRRARWGPQKFVEED